MAARRNAVRSLVSWISSDDPWDAVRIITGSPGCGKSRLVAWTVMAAGAETRQSVPDVRGLLPPLGAFDIAVDAEGRTVGEQQFMLAQAMLAHDAEYGHGLPLIDVARAAEQRGAPFTVAVTGTSRCGRISGGGEPDAALERVVLPLATISRAVRRSVKLSRSPVRLLLELPPAQALRLVERAGLPDTCLLNLDSEDYAPHREEFRDWVEWLLTARGSADRPASASRGRLASIVAERTWPNFLAAETLALGLRARMPQAAPPSSAEVPRDMGHIWQSAVHCLRGPSEFSDALTAPVVLAQGPLGMPETLCADAAAALLGRELPVEEYDQYTRPMAPFLSEGFVSQPSSASDGPPVRHLRLRNAALAEAARRTYGDRAHDMERRIASVVKAYVPTDVASLVGSGGPGMSPEQDYALGAGLGHALAGGTVDDWLADPVIVLFADPSALGEATRSAGETPPGPGPGPGPVGIRRAAVTQERRMYGGIAARGLGDHAARLRLSAVVRHDHALVGWIDGSGVPLPWVTDWVHWRPLGEFDPTTFDTEWPGPVGLRGRRVSGGAEQFCTRSRYDGSYQWWNLEDGSAAGPAMYDAPSENTFPPSGAAAGTTTREAVFKRGDDGSVLMSRGEGEPEVLVLPPGHVAEIQPLPHGRALLAGPSGLMLVSSSRPLAGQPVARRTTTAACSKFLPNPAWWSKDALRAEDVSSLYSVLGGPVTTDRTRLSAIASILSDAARLLTDAGLPSGPMWFEGLDELVPGLPSLREFWAVEGYEADPAEADFLVFGHTGDESMPVCVDPASGRIMGVDDAGVWRPVNSSLASFLRCWTVAVWALAFSGERVEGERAEFREFVQGRLREIDPLATAPENPAWPRLIRESVYILE